jgi:hypothetical protein
MGKKFFSGPFRLPIPAIGLTFKNSRTDDKCRYAETPFPQMTFTLQEEFAVKGCSYV